VGEYIGGGTFGKVFSGHYHGPSRGAGIGEAYKEKKKAKELRQIRIQF
jgi:hypothetical protein